MNDDMAKRILEKQRGLDGPTLLALVDAFPGARAGVDAVLAGEKEIRLEDVIRLLVDRNGRCIFQPEVLAPVCDPNSNYHFDVVMLNIKEADELLKKWARFFGQPPSTNGDTFLKLIAQITAKVATDSSVNKLLFGPCFPILLPKIELGEGGYGAMVENFLLPAAEQGYTTAFPGRKFINYHKGELANQVTIVDERHKQMVSDLAQGPIPGILYFPLQGFSVYAQRQMAKLMPDYMSLAGPIEIGSAEALYPQQLSYDGNILTKNCSAVDWEGPGSSLCFDAYNAVRLEFVSITNLNRARSHFSGALFLRG